MTELLLQRQKEGPSRLEQLFKICYFARKDHVGKEKIEIAWILPTMFLIDLESFAQLGQSISGCKWYKGNREFPDLPVPEGLNKLM